MFHSNKLLATRFSISAHGQLTGYMIRPTKRIRGDTSVTSVIQQAHNTQHERTSIMSAQYYTARFNCGALTGWEVCGSKTLQAAKWEATKQVMGTAGYPLHRIIVGQKNKAGTIKPIVSRSTHPGSHWIQ